MEEFRKMQRLVETSSFRLLEITPKTALISELENSLDWRNWLDLQSESRFFIEKQTLDLNTTTQTTSRNNESLTLKKKDSDLLGFQSRAIEGAKLGGNFPGRKISKNVSDVNCAALGRKREFMKSLLDKQAERNQNKSEIVQTAFKHPFEPFSVKKVPVEQDFLKQNHQKNPNFSKKRFEKFSKSEIPNNTISSENDFEEDKKSEKEEVEMEAWNGMVNSISDLRETRIHQNESCAFEEASPQTPLEGSEDLKTDKKRIFGEKQEAQDLNLQTPEVGEFSYGNGFYSRQKQPNSSKILYKLYEDPVQGFHVDDLLHKHFVKKQEMAEEGEDFLNEEVSGSEDAKEASCFVKRKEVSSKFD